MRALVLLPPLLLAACHKEPAFDERYDKAAKEIEARAKAMDSDIVAADKAARDAGTEKAPPSLPPVKKPSNPPLSSGE